jgi:hypothetical protein
MSLKPLSICAQPREFVSWERYASCQYGNLERNNVDGCGTALSEMPDADERFRCDTDHAHDSG